MNNVSGKDIVYVKSRTSVSMCNWADSTILKDCKSNVMKNRTIIITSGKMEEKMNMGNVVKYS